MFARSTFGRHFKQRWQDRFSSFQRAITVLASGNAHYVALAANSSDPYELVLPKNTLHL